MITRIITQLDTDGETFAELSNNERNVYQKHYENVPRRNARILRVMAREASIQLVYQSALFFYEYLHPPILDVDFTNKELNVFNMTPSVQWRLWLTFQMLSLLLSGYSTFNPIIEDLKFKTYVNDRCHAGFWNYALRVFQVTIHIWTTTFVVFLE